MRHTFIHDRTGLDGLFFLLFSVSGAFAVGGRLWGSSKLGFDASWQHGVLFNGSTEPNHRACAVNEARVVGIDACRVVSLLTRRDETMSCVGCRIDCFVGSLVHWLFLD